MKIYKLDNTQRGLEDKSRRPVVSRKTREIDKLIKQEFTKVRNIIPDMVAYTKIEEEPPKEMIAKLQRRIENVFLLTKRRIDFLQQLSEKEIKKVLGYTEEIAKMPYIDEDWRDVSINEIYQACVRRLREKLGWQMRKMETNNHPYWHKEAMRTLILISQFGIDTEEEVADVQEKEKKYQRQEERRIEAEKKRMEGMVQDHSKTYKRIQQDPDEDIFAREKARGTANRGT